ncbi:MAG: FtsX-like permease family protein [Clostridiales bacterium]|nr:FtsX-like permease family protein [Candidatus Equinaster intestinalis]
MDFRFLKKEIKRNIVSFVTIVVMTLIGVGFLSGLFSCVPDIKASVNDYYNETNFHDIKITASHGFLDEDIHQVERLEYLDKIQPAHSLYSLSSINGAGSYATYVRSVDRSVLEANAAALVDMPVLKEGSYPATPKSCLVVTTNATDVNVKIGDRLALLTNTEGCIENTFTVTGFVNTPEFTSNIKEDAPIGNGKTEIIVYVSDEIFASDVLYNEILCTVKDKDDLSTFDKDYTEKIKGIKADITKLGNERSANFAETLSSQYEDDRNIAQKRYEYVKGQTEEELKTVSRNISSLEKNITELEAAIKVKEEEVARLKVEADNLVTSIDATTSRVMVTVDADRLFAPEPGEEPTESEATEPDNSETESTAESEVVSSEPEAPKELTEYEKALQKYEAANAQLTAQKKDLETKKNTLKSLKSEYSILKGLAGEKVDNAEQHMESFEGDEGNYEQKWSVLTREDNISFNSFLMNAQKINTISGFFPVIFFIVAVSLVLTLIGRMINNQRRELGIWQSLGYSDRAITVKYALYALSATLIGGITGVVAGVIVIPKLMFNTYSVFYNFPEMELLFRPFATFGALLIEAVLVLAVTLLSCIKLLKGSPAQLLRSAKEIPEKPIFLQKKKKRWAKYSEKKKSILKGIFTYKSRLAVMMIGIIGTVSLIFSCLAINHSIGSVTEIQYKLRPFDAAIALSDSDEVSNEEIIGAVENKEIIEDYISVKQSKISVIYNEKASEATAVLCDNEKFGEYYNLKNTFGSSIGIDENSVIVSRNFASAAGIGKSDEIELARKDKTVKVKITGICRGYIGNYIFLGKNVCADFANDFGDTILIKNGTAGYNKGEITSKLLQTGKVSAVSFTADEFGIFGNAADKIKTLLTVLIIAASLLCLAVIVITTLLNFRERRERISGEKNGSIFAENMIITAAGIIIGLVVGAVLHTAVISLANVSDVMLSHSMGIWAFAAAIAIPLLLTIAANLVILAVIKIRKKLQ